MLLSRRRFTTLLGTLAMGGLVTAAHATEVLEGPLGRGKQRRRAPKAGTRAGAHGEPLARGHETPKALATPEDIWADLMEGNGRFVAGKPRGRNLVPARARLAKGQHPRVIVLTCSDSRVSPTLIFDKSLGDLFVVRTAGNVADEVGLGSLEYAAEHLHAPVLVVMGHEGCGAVAAALSGEKMPSPYLDAIVRRIAPAVDRARVCGDGAQNVNMAVEMNVRQSAHDIVEQSGLFAELVAARKLSVIRAVYRLKTGEVVRLS